MSIKRYIADKDTTITDAYKENLTTRGIYSNMGESDSLEVFSLYAQASTSSLEKSRILIEFPIDKIALDRQLGKIPQSGSVNFFLKLFNVRHPFSVPRKFTLNASAVSQSWEEGYGLDMEGYSDPGFGDSGYGADWVYCLSGTTWNTQGGDVLQNYSASQYFETGLEDMNVDITHIAEQWIAGTLQNNGFLIKLSGAAEDGSTFNSFYTKKFSARGSEFYMRRPCIEAQWNPSSTDDRNNFYANSNLLSPADNTMNIYFYNKVNGTLKNIYSNPNLSISFYSDANKTQTITPNSVSVTNPLPGIYKAEVILDTTASVVYDKWYSGSTEYYSDSIDVLQRTNSSYDTTPEYILNITNLKKAYTQEETAKFKIFARKKDWSPTVYTVSYNNIENTQINNLYYKIFRIEDNYTIIDYSTGSIAYSKTSYDSQGNFFDLDMNILEKDYTYGIKLATYEETQLKEFNTIFKFKVE
jgi:hypothetical protein